MIHTSEMKFDDHQFPDSLNSPVYDPLLESIDRDYWQRHSDEAHYEYLNRQEQTFLQISNNASNIVDMDHMDYNWIDCDNERRQPPIARILSGSVTLALLGYLYWML